MGIFVGPMVLAVAYRLLEAWVCEEATVAKTVPATQHREKLTALLEQDHP